ncbi:protein MODIFIER OF SNC1 11 [Melia azedarach]|uniref:Protein MODIFIER OF SNC1 11 n=2 Tax=Melia azedarach TaxID=155640 RepID=A0ACC1X0V7_MELAZ|nr:protein MODIFIER OF SNC1 11 [Melia azedarach]KAJ4704802.1 protein MODIFIER OF SNC1 11 [Melia azedarach]
MPRIRSPPRLRRLRYRGMTVRSPTLRRRSAEPSGLGCQYSCLSKRSVILVLKGLDLDPRCRYQKYQRSSEELKRKARAERFGLPVPSSAGDEEAKRKARLARFAPYPKTDSLEEDKKKARAIRFSETSSSSLSQVNGKGNIEPKAAITGKAGGGD